ncbi:MAG TPA: SGNH/GDSL hydrolase family protein [Longimicrobiales bacterium]|nr:SGNH/GDSL hydrolase family protein [Longimicrobiales bacterium]
MADRWWSPIKESKYRRRRNRLPRILTEGDSWFDYPLYRNVIDFIDDTDRWAIKRLERSGDKLTDILARFDEYAEIVGIEKPRAVMLSAGGNDLVADDWIDDLFTEEEPYIDREVWDAKLAELEEGYERLIDAVPEDTPVIGHGYDHMIPSDKGVRVDGLNVTGPWVQKAMLAKGIDDPATQRALARIIIDDFNEMMRSLAERLPHFHFVDLRGTLDPEKDWPNEMHPYEYGFELVATKMRRELERLV